MTEGDFERTRFPEGDPLGLGRGMSTLLTLLKI